MSTIQRTGYVTVHRERNGQQSTGIGSTRMRMRDQDCFLVCTWVPARVWPSTVMKGRLAGV